MIDEVIRYSLISSPLKPIKTDKFEFRAQINVLLNAPFGAGKTQLLELIEKKRLGYRVMNWTAAGLLGSIRKDGEIVPPMTIICAGKTVLIDEFQSVPSQLRLPLLSLMEEQRAERILNFKVPQPIYHEAKYWSVYAKEGYMTFRLRSSFIIATSRVGTSHLDRMLQSRCIQINLQFFYDDLKFGITDIKLDDIEDLRKELDEKQGYISESKMKEVLEYVIDELKMKDIPPNYAYRVNGDLIRIMNIEEQLGGDPDRAFRYLDFILHGILGSEFTPLELKVYASLNGQTPLSEIRERFGISNKYVSIILDRLMEKGLIRRVKKDVYSKVSRH